MDSFKTFIAERDQDARKIAGALKTKIWPTPKLFGLFGSGKVSFSTWTELKALLKKAYTLKYLGSGHFSAAFNGKPRGAKGRFPKQFVLKVSRPGKGQKDTYARFAKIATKLHQTNPLFPEILAIEALPRGEDWDDPKHDADKKGKGIFDTPNSKDSRDTRDIGKINQFNYGHEYEDVEDDEPVWIAVIKYLETRESTQSEEVKYALDMFSTFMRRVEGGEDLNYEHETLLKRIESVSPSILEVAENLDLNDVEQFIDIIQNSRGGVDMHPGNIGIDFDKKTFVVFDPISFGNSDY